MCSKSGNTPLLGSRHGNDLDLLPSWEPVRSPSVRVIARKKLRQFWEKHPNSKTPLQVWHSEFRKAKWTTTAQVKTHYPSASFAANARIIFNIKGNKYRLIIHFRPPIAYIRFIGTHADYDRIDPNKI